MVATAQITPVDVLGARQPRKVGLRAKDGTIYGPNWTVPKGDFAHFLGYKAPTKEEQEGNVSGRRAIEVALHRDMNRLGKRAVQNAMAYRNLYISHDAYLNQPGRERELIQDGLDAVRQSVEVGQAMGIRYLEMQYMMHTMSKNFGVISQLMRVRSDAIKKAINEVR